MNPDTICFCGISFSTGMDLILHTPRNGEEYKSETKFYLEDMIHASRDPMNSYLAFLASAIQQRNTMGIISPANCNNSVSGKGTSDHSSLCFPACMYTHVYLDECVGSVERCMTEKNAYDVHVFI